MKKCPYCAEEMQDDAIKCKHCGSFLDEQVNNLLLIKNNFKHIICEIDSHEPFFFRIATESHLALYRTMIQALRGTSNYFVQEHKKNPKYIYYKFDTSPRFRIKKIPVSECKKAWRFSAPEECEQITEENHIDKKNSLIGFYVSLAKIQADCFMKRYVNSNPIKITDIEMKKLESLHENIRNPFEHYIPHSRLESKEDLKEKSLLCMNLIKKLFESRNFIFASMPELISLIDSIEEKLNYR